MPHQVRWEASLWAAVSGCSQGSGDALPYRNRLNAGKYLLVVRGSEALTRQATTILRQYDPENLQGYVDTSDA